MPVFIVQPQQGLARGRAVATTLFALLAIAWAGPVVARGLKPLEVKQSYREVLTLLAEDQESQALTRLTEFEQAAVGDTQAWRYTDNLWRAKLQVIRDLLGTRGPELLRPIVVLHHDAYFEYVKSGRRHLAHHSRTMSSELADLYVARAATPEAAAFAGWVMTSFAAHLWSPSNIGESADFFFRAKEHDPANSVALEGLSAAYERGGNYEMAIESLVLALRRDPDRAELLLRLALCTLRAGGAEPGPAIDRLERLTQAPTPAWIRSVAYQELARRQIESEQIDDGVATLRRALAELPGDQQLCLQLASVLDSQRRRAEAVEVLDQIEIAGWRQGSPRLTYDFWMPPDLETIRHRLHEGMENGREVLAASLAGGVGP